MYTKSILIAALCILFSAKSEPLNNLIKLPPEERFEEAKRRFATKTWEGQYTKHKDFLKELKGSFFKDGFNKGILLMEAALIDHMNPRLDENRKIAIKKLKSLQEDFTEEGDYLTGVYYQVLCKILFFSNQEKEAVKTCLKALPYLEGLEVAQVNHTLANAYHWVGETQKGLEIVEKNYKLIEGQNFSTLEFENLHTLGEISATAGDYAKSNDYLFKALEITEKDKSYESQVELLNLISINKSSLNQVDQAISYLLKAEKLAEEGKVGFESMSYTYQNLSGRYQELEQFDKATYYAIKSVEIAEKNGIQNDVLTGKFTLADSYLSQKKYKQALQILQQTKTIDEQYWEQYLKGWYANYSAQAYIGLKEYKKAEPLILEAISLMKEYDTEANLVAVYEKTVDLYKALNNPNEALKYQELFYNIQLKTAEEASKKSLYARENQNLALQNKQNLLVLENQQTRLIMMIGFIGAFIIIVVIQFRRHQIVTKKEAIVREKTNDLLGILNNIQQGVVTISLIEGGQRRIHDTSQHFYSIFEDLQDKDLTSSDPIPPLFANSSLSKEEISKIDSVLISSAGEDLIQWEINYEHLPTEMTINDGSKIIELDWAVILDGDKVTKVIITFKDVTTIRALNARDQQNEENLQKLIALSLMDQKEYFLFMMTVDQMLQENMDVLLSSESYSRDTLDLVNRNLHTIKGMARNYDMIKLSSFIHDTEEFFQKERDRVVTYDRDLSLIKLSEVKEEVESYRTLAKNKLKWDDEALMISLSVDSLTEWYETIATYNREMAGNRRLDLLLKKIKKTYSTSFRDSLNSIILSSQKLAKELKRGDIKFILEGCDVFVSKNFQDKVGSIFIHLFRNSIDHGFLPLDERIEKGMPDPEIVIQMKRQERAYDVFVSDNGLGIHLDSLLDKAGDSVDIDFQDELEVARLIFRPGLSTKQKITDISGRGVGMDAVKDAIESLGGSINIFATGKASHGYLPIKFHLSLPLAFFDD